LESSDNPVAHIARFFEACCHGWWKWWLSHLHRTLEVKIWLAGMNAREKERKLQQGLTIWLLLTLQLDGFNQVVHHAWLVQRHSAACSSVISVGDSVDSGKLGVSEISAGVDKGNVP